MLNIVNTVFNDSYICITHAMHCHAQTAQNQTPCSEHSTNVISAPCPRTRMRLDLIDVSTKWHLLPGEQSNVECDALIEGGVHLLSAVSKLLLT